MKPTGGWRGPRDARGLSPSRARVLDLMLTGITDPRKLAEAMQTSRQNVYGHLACLIDEGWVRKFSPGNNRVGVYEVTPKAKGFQAFDQIAAMTPDAALTRQIDQIGGA